MIKVTLTFCPICTAKVLGFKFRVWLEKYTSGKYCKNCLPLN